MRTRLVAVECVVEDQADPPNPDSPHLGIDLPFDLESGEFRWDVWQRWMEWDPVRLVERYAGNLRKLRLIYVDCGTKDEFTLHWGARALVARTEREDDALEMSLAKLFSLFI